MSASACAALAAATAWRVRARVARWWWCVAGGDAATKASSRHTGKRMHRGRACDTRHAPANTPRPAARLAARSPLWPAAAAPAAPAGLRCWHHWRRRQPLCVVACAGQAAAGRRRGVLCARPGRGRIAALCLPLSRFTHLATCSLSGTAVLLQRRPAAAATARRLRPFRFAGSSPGVSRAVGGGCARGACGVRCAQWWW